VVRHHQQHRHIGHARLCPVPVVSIGNTSGVFYAPRATTGQPTGLFMWRSNYALHLQAPTACFIRTGRCSYPGATCHVWTLRNPSPRPPAYEGAVHNWNIQRGIKDVTDGTIDIPQCYSEQLVGPVHPPTILAGWVVQRLGRGLHTFDWHPTLR